MLTTYLMGLSVFLLSQMTAIRSLVRLSVAKGSLTGLSLTINLLKCNSLRGARNSPLFSLSPRPFTHSFTYTSVLCPESTTSSRVTVCFLSQPSSTRLHHSFNNSEPNPKSVIGSSAPHPLTPCEHDSSLTFKGITSVDNMMEKGSALYLPQAFASCCNRLKIVFRPYTSIHCLFCICSSLLQSVHLRLSLPCQDSVSRFLTCSVGKLAAVLGQLFAVVFR